MKFSYLRQIPFLMVALCLASSAVTASIANAKAHVAFQKLSKMKPLHYQCSVEKNGFVTTLPKHRKLDLSVKGGQIALNRKRLYFKGQNPYTAQFEFGFSKGGPVSISMTADTFSGGFRNLSTNASNGLAKSGPKLNLKSQQVGYWVYNCAQNL